MSGGMLKPDLPTFETPIRKGKLLLTPKQIMATKVDDLLGKSTLNLTRLQKLPAKALSTKNISSVKTSLKVRIYSFLREPNSIWLMTNEW
jgi:hypothetical protein